MVKKSDDCGDYNNTQKGEAAVTEEKGFENSEADVEPSSITTRKKPLEQAVIDVYLQRNKHKVKLPLL